MNDQRFNELLNLHLDHETTPAQAAEFEAELNRTPARRREYAAYCRMHHACAHLIERERSLAPASFALEKARLDAERTAAATARPAVRRPLVTAFAGFAAMAACLALVFTRLSPEPSSAHGQPGPTGSTVASTATPASAAPAAPDASKEEAPNDERRRVGLLSFGFDGGSASGAAGAAEAGGQAAACADDAHTRCRGCSSWSTGGTTLLLWAATFLLPYVLSAARFCAARRP